MEQILLAPGPDGDLSPAKVCHDFHSNGVRIDAVGRDLAVRKDGLDAGFGRAVFLHPPVSVAALDRMNEGW